MSARVLGRARETKTARDLIYRARRQIPGQTGFMLSYLKVRHGRKSVEFFFAQQDATALATAKRQAEAYHAALLEGAPDGADIETTVFRHGVPGLGDLRCVGGCELCSSRPLSLVDDGS